MAVISYCPFIYGRMQFVKNGSILTNIEGDTSKTDRLPNSIVLIICALMSQHDLSKSDSPKDLNLTSGSKILTIFHELPHFQWYNLSNQNQ